MLKIQNTSSLRYDAFSSSGSLRIWYQTFETIQLLILFLRAEYPEWLGAAGRLVAGVPTLPLPLALLPKSSVYTLKSFVVHRTISVELLESRPKRGVLTGHKNIEWQSNVAWVIVLWLG